jgi:hypothetical protein
VSQIIAVLPASSVDCERGFSNLNAIKRENRSQLTDETLGHLMRIRSTEMTAKSFVRDHSDTLLNTWWNTKDRRSGGKDDALLIDRPNWMPMFRSI